MSKISRSQDFNEISGFIMGFQYFIDFKISYGFQDLNEISQDLTQIFLRSPEFNFSTVMIVIMDDSWEVVTKMY